MSEETADLEPQADANASYVDKSIDTSIPVEVESKAEEPEAEVEAQPESEAESSPAVEENDEKTIDADDDPEFSDRVKARIDEVTGKWRETQRLLTAREQHIADIEKRLAEVPKQEEPFKTLKDFDYDEVAHQQYMAAEISSRAEVAAKRVAQDYESEKARRLADETFAVREAEFASTVTDYRDKVHDPSLRISLPMKNVFTAVDDGPELAYYLGNNPDIARTIASLPGEQAGYELGLIRANLTAEKQKAKLRKVTKAPPPTAKIKAGDAGVKKDPADMTDKEFANWRRKQIAQR